MNDVITFDNGSTILFATYDEGVKAIEGNSTIIGWLCDELFEWEGFWRDNKCKHDDLWDE